MPYAVKEGGWWSLTILVVLGIITCYTGILLQRCLESASSLQTYPDIGQAAFGVYGRICIAVSNEKYSTFSKQTINSYLIFYFY